MRNIFENAKFGDKFVTKNGKIVEFECYNSNNTTKPVYVIPVTCTIDGYKLYYEMNGYASNVSSYISRGRKSFSMDEIREMDVVLKYQEHTDEPNEVKDETKPHSFVVTFRSGTTESMNEKLIKICNWLIYNEIWFELVSNDGYRTLYVNNINTLEIKQFEREFTKQEIYLEQL